MFSLLGANSESTAEEAKAKLDQGFRVGFSADHVVCLKGKLSRKSFEQTSHGFLSLSSSAMLSIVLALSMVAVCGSDTMSLHEFWSA